MEFSRLAYIFGGQNLQDEEPENSVFVQPEKLKAAEQRDGFAVLSEAEVLEALWRVTGVMHME